MDVPEFEPILTLSPLLSMGFKFAISGHKREFGAKISSLTYTT
jgi:hypothetical protein